MPVDHYENFPVASWLLPAPMREPVEAIYGFARGADDIADEGDADDATRLAGLAEYSRALDEIEAGRTVPYPPFERAGRAIREHHLPVQLFRDLIDAFSQDVTTKRYATYPDLLDYCRRSANPVGRLLLHLFGRTDARSLSQSDAICTSLQLINFWQDVAIDWQKGRVYIPQEDLVRFGVPEASIGEARVDDAWRKVMAFQCERSRALMRSGAPLGQALPGRLGLEIRAVVAGGERILDKIEAVAGDVFRHRPVLGKADWLVILARAFARLT